jgi:hypothetical protein
MLARNSYLPQPPMLLEHMLITSLADTLTPTPNDDPNVAPYPWNDAYWNTHRYPYRNSETGRPYQPHHADEERFVFSDQPRAALAKGGEGGGKSVAGIIKGLERVRRQMSGIMGSPDFEHFKRSLWPEFRRWCPPDALVASQRYRLRPDWEPQRPFILTFVTGARVLCGGFDDPTAWEGPNVSWGHSDEARRHRDAKMLKVMDGRCRIPGPHGEPPQHWYTTTPAKNWLFEYFGPWETPDEVDPLADFKAETLVIDLPTEENERAGNLAAGYTAQRRRSLTESEARVLLDAGWEDIDDASRLLPSMIWWDACRAYVPPLTPQTPLVLAADAGVNNDSFGLIAVSRHWYRPQDVAVRWVKEWQPKNGESLPFTEIENEIRTFCRIWNVKHLCYDPYQLHQMMQRLQNDRVVWTSPFSQQTERLLADKQLVDLIQQQRIVHDGNAALRQHIDNADAKKSDDRKTLRIVKRTGSRKIDLAVTLSMAAKRCLDLDMSVEEEPEEETPGAGERRW